MKESMKNRLLLFGLALLLSVTSWGCSSTRGVMFIKPMRVGKYLAQHGYNDLKNKKNLTSAEKKKLAHQKLMSKVPDGDRILGGFCTDSQVVAQLNELQTIQSQCQKKLKYHTDRAAVQGTLYWSFLLGTVGTGTAMIIGGVAASKDAAPVLAVLFGGLTLSSALISGIFGFDGNQERHKLRAQRLDNYMWTLRVRIVSEVCNAKSVEIARAKLKRIQQRTRYFCSMQPDDGIYRPPTN